MQLGVSEDELRAARRAESSDAKFDAGLKLVKAMLEKHGHVADSDIEAARGAGYDDGEIMEITANVAANIFTNFTNHVAETDIDFPLAPDLP